MTGVPLTSSSRALPRLASARQLHRGETRQRHVVPTVEADLVAGVGDLAYEIGRAFGDLAGHEERAPHAAIARGTRGRGG